MANIVFAICVIFNDFKIIEQFCYLDLISQFLRAKQREICRISYPYGRLNEKKINPSVRLRIIQSMTKW